ncbi:response regulator [Isoptericola sp. S6320L]|uniref:response regulator n=1 Tax=Isoptericola sp. S6320L TaxID=2926411 RepID=UPI001FF6AF81|nr:response regulator [Isoptericola sp. S6320L]MCK0116065.1 response regulator [Isoptericola sp. S6320L]
MVEARRAAARAHALFLRWCWAAGAVMLVLAVVLAGPFDAATRQLVSQSALAAAAVFASVSCGWRAVRSTGRRRRAWGALSLGGIVGLLGNVYATAVGDPSTGDIAYIAALSLGVVGLALFPTVRPRGQEIVRMLLDSVVVGGSVLYIAVFAVVLGGRDWTAQPAVSAYALPVVDALLATLAVLVMTRSSAEERVPLVLVGSGFVLYAVADVAFALFSASGGFTFGSPVDLGWIGGYAAIAVAARHPAASGSPIDSRRPGDGSPVLGTVVTFSLFLAAALVRVVRSGEGVPWVADALWVAVLAAVVIRQILVVVDNESLRHGLERRVEDRTAQLRALAGERERTLESVADGIYGVDAAGRLTFINAAASRTLGATPADLVGCDVHATFHATDADGAPYPVEGCYITEAVRDGVTTTAEQDVYLRLDGKEVPVEVTASPLRDDGTIRGAVVVFRDVTERREMERIKDEFVSVVSHELRTPLTSIRGSLGLLDSGVLGDDPERAQRMVHIALTSSERLGRLVDDILDIERMAAGSTQLDLADHRVETLLDSAEEQVSILAEKAGVTLDHDPSAEVVSADADRIVQTLVNVLSNAVKFSPPGSTVRTSVVPVGDMVEVRVDDEGRGIPPDKLEAVFRRFEQVDASDARERGGTGLGLPIARSIVERHGGRMWAVSDGEGTGASLRFTLRRVDPHRAPSGPRTADGEPATRTHAPPSSLAAQEAAVEADAAGPPRVVVVDDDPYVVDVLSTVLEERGFTVLGVTDGRTAIELIAAEHPAAIVLDLAMPGTDGAEVLAQVRRTAATARVPVVVVSGTRPADAREAASLADGWLVKPVDPAQLAGTVRDVARRHPHHEQVLVVEDDDDLRRVVATVLESGGLAVTQARSVEEARQALARVEPDLLLLDLSLPDGTGNALVSDLRRDGRLRQVPLVVYTGSSVGRQEREDLRLGRTVFLAKERTAPQALLGPVLDLLDSVAGRGAPDRTDPDHRGTDERQPDHPHQQGDRHRPDDAGSLRRRPGRRRGR